MICELVSGDMIRRAVRDMAEAHGDSVIRLVSSTSFAISIQDQSQKPWLIALLDTNRQRVIEVVATTMSHVPIEVYQEAFQYIVENQILIDGFENKLGVVRDANNEIHSMFAMPGELELHAPFYLYGPYDIALPRQLHTSSDFILNGARITSMSKKIRIGGDADFSECEFEALPDGAEFQRNLVLRFSSIKKLPRSLSVGRWLKISGTPIETIPSSARIGIGIDAENSVLRIIPPGFSTAGDLKLSGSKVRKLAGIKIGGSVFVERIKDVVISEDCEIGRFIHTDSPELRVPDRLRDYVFQRQSFGYVRMRRSG
jgi:hypothetical protein